jgi:tryptophan synthase alpha chain
MAGVAAMVPRIRRHVGVPVGVGFGIRDAAGACAVARHADAVIIGTRMVQVLQDQSRDNVAAAGRAFIAEIRSALDALDPGEKS